MDSDDPVLRALDELAASDASRRARPHVERAVLDAFDRESTRPLWAGLFSSRWVVGVGTAALLVASVAIGTYVRTSSPSQSTANESSPQARTAGDALAGDDGVQAFTQRVRARIPRAYLPMLGVPIIDPDAEGSVDIEVVLGEDGLQRAIRVLR